VIQLAGGFPASELLPRDRLARALEDVLGRDDALQYGWPEGSEELRAWVAMRLGARGAAVDPQRIIVTAGAQQALSIAGRLLRGKAIGVGDATYAGAIDAFAGAGACPCARSCDASYVIAGVSNPQGIDVVDRADLLAGDAELVVDEAYAELRFDGRMPRALIADAAERVWHVGTVSKTIAPGLRVGWLVPPARYHAAALELKHAADLQAASISQLALVRLLATLDYDELLERARREYAHRCDRLLDALHRHAPHLAITPPEGGFSVWIETDREGNELDLARAALDAGVTFDPGDAFRPEPTACISLRLSYSSTPPDLFDEGVGRLAHVLSRPTVA
jgi:2-aminoadipate transaminase